MMHQSDHIRDERLLIIKEIIGYFADNLLSEWKSGIQISDLFHITVIEKKRHLF